MDTRSASVEVTQSSGLVSRLSPGLPSHKKREAASALTLLRKPTYVVSVLALASTSSAIALLRFGWTTQAYCLLPLLIMLSVTAVLDFRTKLIPDVLTLPGIAYALLIAFFTGYSPLSDAVLGAVGGGGLILLLAVISRGAVGGGDIKLMAMLGAVLGWKGALALFALSQVAAAVIALLLLLTRRAKLNDSLPVGTIISILGIITLLGRP